MNTRIQPQRFLCDIAYSLTINNARALLLLSALLLITNRAPASPPTVSLNSAVVTSTNALINGTINPNGLTTGFFVQWGPTTSYGSTSGVYPMLAQSTPVAVSNYMTSLSPSTLYHYQMVATNADGTGSSADATLTTQPVSPGGPAVTVNPATQVTSSQAMITGTINPNGLPTGYWVQYGTTTSYGTASPVLSLAAQFGAVGVTNWMTGLSGNTLYHYRLMATNANGTGYSADMMVTTPGAGGVPPSVSTGAASAITGNTASLAGTVNPNGFATTYYFQWGTSVAYGNVTAPGSFTAQMGVFDVGAGLTGLSPDTTYHYQLVATNSGGSSYGADQTFTTAKVITIGSDTYTYTIASGGVTIVGYSGPGGSLTIPDLIEGLPVTTIASSAFASALTVTNILLPDSLTVIGDGAFSGSGLTRVTIPDSVTYLGPSAFYYCSRLADVTFGSGLTNLPYGVFSLCGLTNLIIPPNITSIGMEAFSMTPITNVTFPETLRIIGQGAFYSCGNLASITIPDSVQDIGAAAFAGCGSVTNLQLGKGITTLNGGAGTGQYGTFQWCTSLTRLVIPDNVTNISNGNIHLGGSLGVFYGCNGLTNVVIGKGLLYLGTGAFNYCVNLLSVFFQGNAPTVGVDYFGEDVFHVDDLAIVYYLPGTTGWGTTYGGCPAVLWNPHVQTSDPSFGLRDTGFGFKIAGTPDIPLVIEACTKPCAEPWVQVGSCTLTNGLLDFKDPEATGYAARFYRFRSP